MGISALITIIGKNFKIFGRSKLSALAIILFPVLIVLLAGLAFNSINLSGVVVGTYSESYTNLTENIIADFEEQNFLTTRFESTEDCISSVKESKTQICIAFPTDLTTTGSSEEVLFYVDHSRLNLAYSLINNIEGKISAEASNIGITLAQDLINILESVKTTLPSQKTEISNSITQLQQIKKDAQSITLSSELGETIEGLQEIESGDQTTQGKIAEAITLLKSIKTINSEAATKLINIENSGEKASLSLEKVSTNIDETINSLSTTNVLEAERIISPIKTKINPIGENSTNRDYFFPTLLAIIALFGGMLLSSTFILKERKTKAYFRNFMTPTWDITFILGSYFTCLLILTLQFLLIFAGIIWILKMPLLTTLPEVALVLFVSLNVFIFFGMFIGYLFKSTETIIFSSVLTASILMFFSNAILPVETITGRFKDLAKFNPLFVSETALKKTMLFNFNWQQILPEIYILLGFTLGFILLTYIGRKLIKKRL